MLNLTFISLILIPMLVYWLSKKPGIRKDVMPDYKVPQDMEVWSCPTHWGIPAGTARLNRALLREVICHPAFVEHSVPDVWFKWSATDARRRARQRSAVEGARGVLPIRKHG